MAGICNIVGFVCSAHRDFSKVGVDGMNSNLATAVRTLVILFITWGVVFFTVDVRELKDVPARTFAFLILSGMSTGLSWLFYFKALQVGVASKVAPVDKLSVVFTIILAYLFWANLSPRKSRWAGFSYWAVPW